MFGRRTVEVGEPASKLGGCSTHSFEAAMATCRSCANGYCTDCLVFAFGPAKPPYCVSCALIAAGVRRPLRARAVA